jgi:hypothetical protein
MSMGYRYPGGLEMRYLVIVASLLASPIVAADTQFSVGIAVPGVSIGINQPAYPQMVLVPGYPVYYEPRVRANYFFYDGMYWALQGDNWYASSWYNGPWYAVGPQYVPYYVLRVPVRYYRAPPPYFRGWHANEPPHWGQLWGRNWEQQRNGWNQWNRHYIPAPAPLPGYQQRYSGVRYPYAAEQQRSIRREYYGYNPREDVTREYWQQQPPGQGGKGKGKGHGQGHD